MAPSTSQWVNSQLCLKLPYPAHKFTNQTIIVTGSNVGMGLEAARHFVRLDAAKVILAVRSLSKGEAAKSSIEESEKRLGVVEVWELDLASYASVKSFAERAKGLERLDVLVENAGIYTYTFTLVEEDESTITVNVVSTFLLGLLLLPKLRETSFKEKKETVLTFTGSFVHSLTKFPEREKERIFEGLKVEKDANMNDRYNVSKMIELMGVRELASEITKSGKEGNVVVSIMNPGFVATEIMREASFLFQKFMTVLKAIASRTAEEGGRTLVNAAEGGPETHGQYMDDCKVGEVSAYVRSQDGLETQQRVWKELVEKLEKIQPGISKNI